MRTDWDLDSMELNAATWEMETTQQLQLRECNLCDGMSIYV
jgi:hypothetical protein